ncbi:unnamed protein product, partial [Trichogramma brassicae]
IRLPSTSRFNSKRENHSPAAESSFQAKKALFEATFFQQSSISFLSASAASSKACCFSTSSSSGKASIISCTTTDNCASDLEK